MQSRWIWFIPLGSWFAEIELQWIVASHYLNIQSPPTCYKVMRYASPWCWRRKKVPLESLSGSRLCCHTVSKVEFSTLDDNDADGSVLIGWRLLILAGYPSWSDCCRQRRTPIDDGDLRRLAVCSLPAKGGSNGDSNRWCWVRRSGA